MSRVPGRIAATALAYVMTCSIAGARAADDTPQQVTMRSLHAGHVADAARRFGIPARWIWAVMGQESGGDTGAISQAGAMGLMQIMPATWANLRRRHALGPNPFDARDNIIAGTAYLRDMYDRYGLEGMLAAYNAGPGRYEAYLRNGRPLPSETRAYLHRLLPLVRSEGAFPAVPTPQPAALSWTLAPIFPKALDASKAPVGAADPSPAQDDAARPSGLFVTPTGARP